jgi:hypothetical protein
MSEVDAFYVVEQLQRRLPTPEGRPLMALQDRDITIVSPRHFFDAVALAAEGTADEVQPHLPGLEVAPEVIASKRRAGVAVARREKGIMYLERAMTATYGEDTCRSLYRFAVSDGETFIPVDPNDTPDSLFTRSTDYLDTLFEGATLERIPLSKYRRERGVTELQKRFADRDKRTVLDLATLAGRNNARMRGMWVGQLLDATKGTHKLPAAVRDEFMQYALSRPEAYFDKPDLVAIVANAVHKRRTTSGRS